MNELKHILSKGSILLICLIALNYVYKVTLWQSDLNEYSNIETALKSAKNADILYLGDCSDSYFGDRKDNEKGISQLLDSLLPNKTVATISETGFHAGMFVRILENLPKENSVKTIVVTMNLRSFSANVLYAFTENSIRQRTILLEKRPPLLNRFLLTFKAIKIFKGPELNEAVLKRQQNDKITLASYPNLTLWKQAFEDSSYIQFNESWTKSKQELALGHLKNYGFQINPDENPRIADFDKIVKIAQQKNLKLIFHLLPEKTHKTEELIGTDLTKIITYNRNFLHQRYDNNTAIIIDNMDLLPESDFIEALPNSHFYYSGRKKMAKEIVKFIE